MIFYITRERPVKSKLAVRFQRPLLPRLAAALAFGLVSLAADAAELTVSAAASLTNAFNDIARAYEAAHAGTRVTLNYAASGALLAQLAQGAPVDVFASADEATMDKAQTQKLVDPATRSVFAANTLVLILPASGAPAPTQLSDLLQPTFRRVAIGNLASVPVGRYTKEALDAAGIGAQLEQKLIPSESVRQVLTYVARGEVDAGFVYATDAAIETDKVRVAMTLPTRTPIRYPIARVAASKSPAEAADFIAYVQSPAGRAVLARYGFSAP